MRLRAAGLTLALAAITFKAFLPPGFMFADHSGRIGVVLCSGVTGAASLDLTHGSDQPASPDQGSAGQHCPFAAACEAAFTPQLVALEAPLEPPNFVVAATPRAERPHATHIGPPLPARGPPLQA